MGRGSVVAPAVTRGPAEQRLHLGAVEGRPRILVIARASGRSRRNTQLYNLLVRDIELEVVPAAERYGLGIIPWSPLQGGLLGGVIKKENTGVRRLEGRAAQSLAEHRDEIQAYEDLAEEVGLEPGTLALAWLLTQPAVNAPIIGPRTRDQLDSALPAVELSLSP